MISCRRPQLQKGRQRVSHPVKGKIYAASVSIFNPTGPRIQKPRPVIFMTKHECMDSAFVFPIASFSYEDENKKKCYRTLD